MTIRSLADVPEEFDLDLDLANDAPEEPPTNNDGELICGRTCVDESACTQPVFIPFVSCQIHDLDAPFA